MKTKLTLYLEKSVIEGLKEHAKGLGLSLSKFIEKEYKSLSQKSEVVEPVPEYFKKMKFKDDAMKDLDWKEERYQFLKKKHG